MRTDVSTCLNELAQWYVDNRRELTAPEFDEILRRHCVSDVEVKAMADYIESPEGATRFRYLLREAKIPKTRVSSLGYLELEIPVVRAVEATVEEEPTSSGFHGALNQRWMIVYKRKISDEAIQAAREAGLKVSYREAPKGSGQVLTDVSLPGVKATEIEKATRVFDKFAELYKQVPKYRVYFGDRLPTTVTAKDNSAAIAKGNKVGKVAYVEKLDEPSLLKEPQDTFASMIKRFEEDWMNLGIRAPEGESEADFNRRIREAATEKALREVLEGYRDLAEAKDALEEGVAFYTARGWEVTPRVLREAIEVKERQSKPKEPWQMTRAEAYPAAGVKSITRGESTYIVDRMTPAGYRKPSYPREVIGKTVVSVDGHKAEIIDALNAGKPVPPEVLAEYPELAKPSLLQEKHPWEMTKEERQAEVVRLKRENAAILATPLMSEGSISATQVAMMGKQQRANWERNSMARMDIESQIKTLESDERIARAKARAEEQAVEDKSLHPYLWTKSEWIAQALAKKPQSLSHLTDKKYAAFEGRRWEKSVKYALAQGKAVPPEVLKDYPEAKPSLLQEKKEPWQMTRGEYHDWLRAQATDHQKQVWKSHKDMREAAEKSWDARHKQTIKQALSEGKPIPPEVLKEYGQPPSLLEEKPKEPWEMTRAEYLKHQADLLKIQQTAAAFGMENLGVGPDWRALDLVLPEKWHHGFMYMGTVEQEGHKIYLYKHGITRRYLNVDESGNAWIYRSYIDKYEPVKLQWAIEQVFEGIAEKFRATRETPYDEAYIAKRNKGLQEAGYTVMSVTPGGAEVTAPEASHEAMVKKALEENKPVPEQVLRDYPELVKAHPFVKFVQDLGAILGAEENYLTRQTEHGETTVLKPAAKTKGLQVAINAYDAKEISLAELASALDELLPEYGFPSERDILEFLAYYHGRFKPGATPSEQLMTEAELEEFLKKPPQHEPTSAESETGYREPEAWQITRQEFMESGNVDSLVGWPVSPEAQQAQELRKEAEELLQTAKKGGKGTAAAKSKAHDLLVEADLIGQEYLETHGHKYQVEKAVTEGKPVPLEVLADYRVENFDRSLQGRIVKIPSLNTWVIKWDNGTTSEEYPSNVDLLEPAVGQSLEEEIADLSEILNEENKAASIKSLEKALAKLPAKQVEGIDEVIKAIGDYRGVEKAGMTPEEYQEEKESSWEAIVEAVENLSAEEVEGVLGEKEYWQMTWEEFQQTIEITGTTEDNGSQGWVKSKSGKVLVHEVTSRKLLSPDLWARDLAHDFHENAVADAREAGKLVPVEVLGGYPQIREAWEMPKEEFKKSIRWGAEPAAAIPGEPIEFFGADEDLKNPRATLAQTDKGEFYITRSDGSQVINPREATRYFATRDEAWDEYYRQAMSRAVAEGKLVPPAVLQEHPDWPFYTVPQWPEVKGVFVGGCVHRGLGSSFRASAHAHCVAKLVDVVTGRTWAEEYPGWICVRSSKKVGTVVGRTITVPSGLLWHEYVHILTGHGHDDVWRAKMKELGRPIPERYKKRIRK